MAISGGNKMGAHLRALATRYASNKVARAGVLEGATYEDGTPVAMVAAVQEFGGTITVPEHETTIHRSVNEKTGQFRKGGRFVKAKQSNFETTHTVPEHTVTIPARPFMRDTIAAHQGKWSDVLADALIATKNVDTALELAGGEMAADIRATIIEGDFKPLKEATKRRKGFDTPLVDTSNLLNSINNDIAGKT